jgi:hypothetical protein
VRLAHWLLTELGLTEREAVRALKRQEGYTLQRAVSTVRAARCSAAREAQGGLRVLDLIPLTETFLV